MRSQIVVQTLLCHKHVEMAVLCLGSLLRYSREPICFRVHDDGSLTTEDIEKLLEALPAATFVRRREADQVMGEILKDRPASRAFRTESPTAVKLLDLPHFATSDTILYVDSDVLFLKPFTGLFSLADARTAAVFMNDVDSFYSLRKFDSLLPTRVRLLRNVNTGLMTVRKSVFDLDQIEWFLSQERYHVNIFWREQTCFAMLAAASGCRLYDPRQFIIVTPQAKQLPQQIAAHFVGPSRHLLGVWQNSEQLSVNECPPDSIRFIEAKPFGMAAAAVSLARRATRRVFGQTPD